MIDKKTGFPMFGFKFPDVVRSNFNAKEKFDVQAIDFK